MGRPLFSTCSTSSGFDDTSRSGDVAVARAGEQGPRTWCETDADPDSDTWWNTKKIFVESFTTSATSSERGTTLEPDGRPKAPAASLEREAKPAHKEEIQTDTNFLQLFPKRYTISEEELARVELDMVQIDEEDDFELAWDEEMDVDSESDSTAGHSDTSTPAPSTPVSALRTVSLPVSIPSTPSALTRRRTLPVSLSTTPIRQNSYHASATPSLSPIPIATPSSITTRSVARARGFAVHSPRTELVL